MYIQKEKSIEITAWLVAAFILVVFIPRKKIRKAQLAFMFKQVIT